MEPEQIEALFTRADGQFVFARWGRPIVPVVFGLSDETLPVVKGAVEAVVALAGHQMAETDAEFRSHGSQIRTRLASAQRASPGCLSQKTLRTTPGRPRMALSAQRSRCTSPCCSCESTMLLGTDRLSGEMSLFQRAHAPTKMVRCWWL